MEIKVLRITTVPISLKILLRGQLKFLADNNYEVYCISAEGKEIEELYRDEKIKQHFAINLTRSISPINDIVAIWQCYKIIKQIQPTIVHSYTPKAGLIGMIASYLAGVKIRIHNITGLPLVEKTGILKKILILVEKTVFFFATQVYVNSFELEKYIKKEVSTKVKVLGFGSTNGINGDFFKTTQNIEKQAHTLRIEYGIEENTFVWIYIGRLVKDKGIIELIEAFELFNTKNSSRLVLVGDYETQLDPLPDSTIEKIQKNSKIICVGFQNDVRPYLALSSCLLFPSYREGLPNVPMQAACFNLPVIASDINGCNEIITNGVNGFLVPPKNYQELEKSMNLLFLDNNLRNEMRKTTRSIILEKYDQLKVWHLLLNEYQKLLEKYV